MYWICSSRLNGVMKASDFSLNLQSSKIYFRIPNHLLHFPQKRTSTISAIFSTIACPLRSKWLFSLCIFRTNTVGLTIALLFLNQFEFVVY